MKNYFERSMKALKLAGMSERARECYTRSVRKLVDFYGKTPDLISEEELEDYFLHHMNAAGYMVVKHLENMLPRRKIFT